MVRWLKNKILQSLMSILNPLAIIYLIDIVSDDIVNRLAEELQFHCKSCFYRRRRSIHWKQNVKTAFLLILGSQRTILNSPNERIKTAAGGNGLCEMLTNCIATSQGDDRPNAVTIQQLIYANEISH
ncbi:hypothetical protein Bhyg_12918 [Pseudolycoriella hygida]|uniref:Uncharacterized protein n=1 Tax=Pseudolycoriella hygida TaxID=35572 RepID=A0A9Q0MZ66_9DIPT|nr:hypothetical protein Bhyg_12918 [Pseudolycoriella hygida]